MYIYIRYSTLINGDEHWNYKKSLYEFSSYMNLDLFVVDALHYFSCGMLCFNYSEEF